MLDALDFKILSRLFQQGRVTWTELASEFKLSVPTITDHVKKLEEKNIIKGYSAQINFYALGYSLHAFIFVTLAHPDNQEEFLKMITDLSEVFECHHIAGEDDYLLKVLCKDTLHLDGLLNKELKTIPGVVKTRTTVVLSSPKVDSKNFINCSHTN